MNQLQTQLPNDFEAEQAVLGSIIYDESSLFDIDGVISESSFYAESHQHIFRALLDLSEAKKPIDEVTICDQLKTNKKIQESGGFGYVASLVDYVPSSRNIRFYADIINEKHRLRQLIYSTTKIAQKSRDPGSIIDDLIQEVLSTVDQISKGPKNKKYHGIKELIASRAKEYENFINPKKEKPWIKTGYFDFDKVINGLQKQKLYIIAARPGMGKTSLALNIITQSKKYHKYKGAIVIMTYEMSGDEITDRMVTTIAKVNLNLFQRGKVTDDQLASIHAAMGELSELPIYVIDVTMSIEKLPIELRKIEKEHGFIELLIVDYLQKAKVSDIKKPREQQISLISGLLKEYSKDFDCPVIALAQLNRALENRSDKRPNMSDLRESGAIEQDADVIGFIYRDEVYNEDSQLKGIAQILIEKQRSGPVGKFGLIFHEQFTRFENKTN